MHRIGPHLPPPLPPQTTAKSAKQSDSVRTLGGKAVLDPYAHLDEEDGAPRRLRRQPDPRHHPERRPPQRSPKPDAFSGEIEALFAAALGAPKE